MQAVSVSPLPTSRVQGWPRNRSILAGGVEKRQEVRVAKGQLFSSSKMSQGSGQRLKSDVHLSLPPFPSTILPLGFFFLFFFGAVALSLYRSPLLLHLFPPVDPLYPRPATFFVRPILLNWYQHRGDGCCVSQLGEMR